MIFGLSAFTIVHVVITLVAIASGEVVLFGFLGSRRMDTMTAIYLVFTALTSITGFFFPFHGVTPAIILGILSCILLVPTLAARYAFGMRDAWRWIYVTGAVALLYFNVFVLVVQVFLKVPSFHALAPTGSEPPFLTAQAAALLFFVTAGFMAVRRFRPSP